VILLALTALLCLTQLLDWYSTRTIIAKGGYEQNKIMAFLFDNFGIDCVLAIKTVAVTGLGFFIGSESLPVLVILIGFYGIILMHNWRSMP